MSSSRFFHRTYKDPVVEYYFLPSNKMIRLTKRFGKVLIHRRVFDVITGNGAWLQEPETFMDLLSAEKFALALLHNATTIRYEISSPNSSRICEFTMQYQAA